MDELTTERRRDERHDSWFPVRLALADRVVMAVGRNLSEGGMLLSSSGPAPVGGTVRLECRLPNRAPSVTVMRGEVVRYGRDEAVDYFPHLLAVRLAEPLCPAPVAA